MDENKLREIINELEPKELFRLIDIYNEENNKEVGKILFYLWYNNKPLNFEYIGKDSSNHKWYVRKFNNQ